MFNELGPECICQSSMKCCMTCNFAVYSFLRKANNSSACLALNKALKTCSERIERKKGNEWFRMPQRDKRLQLQNENGKMLISIVLARIKQASANTDAT